MNILITGATDGIGRAAAQDLAARGHDLLIHARNPAKLDALRDELSSTRGAGRIHSYRADFADLDAVSRMAEAILAKTDRLDVLINNAGVYKTDTPRTASGLDVRFVVNLLAPVRLTQALLPIIPESGRVVNLSSAAQSPVDLSALRGETALGDMPAYAQSKLALTQWNRAMAEAHPDGPAFIAVNPGSLLNTNMVRAGWGGSDKPVSIGSDIVVRAATDPAFAGHSGDYFDNDAGRFAPPHSDAKDPVRIKALMGALARLS